MPLAPIYLRKFKLLIGSFDIAPYLTTLNISVPNSEITKSLVWSGSFEVALTDEAFTNGLTESNFDELEHPEVWREGQQFCHLQFFDVDQYFNFPVMVIKDYRWNSSNKTGSGTFTQILELMNYDRKGEQISTTEFGANYPLVNLVYDLIHASVSVNGDLISTVINVPNTITGKLDAPLFSANPIDDAQKYAGVNWHWLSVDNNNHIQVIKRPEDVYVNSVLFKRSRLSVNATPYTDNINFVASEVIVTGSRQVTKQPDLKNTSNLSNEFDSQGRPLCLRTETIKPVGEIFPDQKPGDTTQITATVKTVWYRYKDNNYCAFDPNLYSNLSGLEVTEINDYPTVFGVIGASKDVSQTITVEESIVGLIFKDAPPDPSTIGNPVPSLPSSPQITHPQVNSVTYGPGSPATSAIDSRLLGYAVSSLTIETEDKKVSFVPFGKKFSTVSGYTFGQLLTLTLDSKEILKSTKLEVSTIDFVVPNHVDPKTGKAVRLEVQPQKEQTFNAPTLNVETENLKGTYYLQPSDYNFLLPKRNVQQLNFIPDQSHADSLARQFATREIARKDAIQVTMDLPSEWIRSGFPHFAVADIDRFRVLVENPIIVMRDRSLYFSFLGERLGLIDPVVELNTNIIYIPTDSLHITPTTPIDVYIDNPIIPKQISAFGGTPPYTFSASLPSGLSISSDGWITGTPTTVN